MITSAYPLCSRGQHPIRGPEDRNAQGQCRECRRIDNQKYRAEQRGARDALVQIANLLAAQGIQLPPEGQHQ